MILLLSSAATIAILSALWLGAFLLVWRLMRLRIVALEERVVAFSQQLDHMRRSFAEARAPSLPPAGNGPSPVNEFTRLNETLDALREAQAEHATTVTRLVALVEGLATDVESGRAERLEDRIRARFSSRGFTNLRILGDLAASTDASPSLRIPLEGMKGGVTYKGYVVLEAGNIVDEKLTSSHEAFP
jgi:hypothetical protein